MIILSFAESSSDGTIHNVTISDMFDDERRDEARFQPLLKSTCGFGIEVPTPHTLSFLLPPRSLPEYHTMAIRKGFMKNWFAVEVNKTFSNPQVELTFNSGRPNVKHFGYGYICAR